MSTEPEVVSNPAPSKWDAFVTPFAQAIGKPVTEVTEALKALVGEPNDAAVELFASEDNTPFAEIKTVLPGIPLAILRRSVAELRTRARPAAAATSNTLMATPSLEGLPNVPDDDAWLSALKAGGELKVNTTTVVAGMRAALASRVGLYEIPALLVEQMERNAENLEEPVGPEFYKLRKLLTRRDYAEIFAALGIEGGSVATQARKNAFIAKLNSTLWPALLGFKEQLNGWSISWSQAFGNPGAMMAVLASATVSGARGAALPPGMMAPPPTDTLRDAAEEVAVVINRVFAGLGIPAALALGFDAQNIKQVLESPTLPAQVGALNREQMLKALRVDVTADYVRLERNVTRFVLAVLEFSKVTPDVETGYITSMLMLGNQIPWEKLAAPSRVLRGSPRVVVDNE